jgi:hypothetical protein
VSACVIANPAHELLLGTNFLSKYGIILDLGEDKMFIPNGNNEYSSNTICASKQVRIFRSKETKMKLHSKKHVLVAPNSEKIIEVDELVNDKKLQTNSILLCEQCTNKQFNIIPGVADTCNLPSKLIIQNNSPRTITIQKNEVVSLVKEYGSAMILEVKSNDYPININEIVKNCELENDEMQIFKIELEKQLSEIKPKKQSDVSHEIKLIDETPKSDIATRPYRTSMQQKKEIENQVAKLKDENLIRESHSRFSSPVVMVKKRIVL